jgi:hypothetical protein
MDSESTVETPLSGEDVTYYPKQQFQRLKRVYIVTTVVSHVIIFICTCVISLYSYVLRSTFPTKHTDTLSHSCLYERMRSFVLVLGMLTTFQAIWILLDMTFSLIGYRFMSYRALQKRKEKRSSLSKKHCSHQQHSQQEEENEKICSSNGSSMIRFFFQIANTFICIFMATENWAQRQKCLQEQPNTFHAMTNWLIVCFVSCALHWFVYLVETLILKVLSWSLT